MNNLSVNKSDTVFKAKFTNNGAFKEVVHYANEVKKLPQLESALHNIDMANPGDILLIHGKAADNIFSSFRMGNKTVYNFANGETNPIAVSLKSILELGELGTKFRRLVGGNVSYKVSEEDIIKRYTNTFSI